MKSVLPGSKHLALTLSIALLLFSSVLRADEACSIKVSIGSSKSLNFHPTKLKYTSNRFVAKNTYLSLFELGIEGEAVPVFAQSWQIDEENKRVRIKLNTSCRWSNGEAITAQQMADGIRLVHQHGGKSPGLDNIRGNQGVRSGERPASDLGVQALSDDELEIEYETNFDLLRYALANVSQTPLYPSLSDVDSENFPQSLPTVSSGAYVVKEQNDEKIVLERNPYFCEGMAGNVDEVVFLRNIPHRAEIGAFEQGIIDILPEYHVKSYYSLEQRMAESGDIQATDVNSDNLSIYLMLNQNTEALTSASVREAIKLVIDHDLLTSNAVFGSAFKLSGGFTPQYVGYTSTPFSWHEKQPYPDRQAKAREIMERMGYSKDNRLKLLVPNTENDARNAAVHALAGMLRAIHIEPEFQVYNGSRDYYSALKAGNYDIAFLIWGDVYPDPSQALNSIFLLSQSAPEKIEQDLKNKLHSSALISDRQERFAVLNEIEEEFHKIGNVFPLYTKSSMLISKKNINLTDLQLGYLRGYNNTRCQ